MMRPWYANGLSFHCTQCGNCCSGPSTGYVWVDDDEIQQMAESLAMSEQVEEFEKRYVRTVGARKSLVEYSDGDCIFLDPRTRQCIVYDARPIQCRTWPFWNRNLKSLQAWEAAAEKCPGCNRGPIYPLESIETARRQKAV